MLKIKGKKEAVDEIELKEFPDYVNVEINGRCVANFSADGRFNFHGTKGGFEYKGEWKSKE